VNEQPHILIADDHDLFRRGLRYALVDTIPDVRVSEANTLDSALQQLSASNDIAVASFDLRMPGMRDGQALPDIRRQYPNLPIVILSAREGRRVILQMLEFGASGFIPKSLPAVDIVAALLDVMVGRIYVPPHITALDPGAGTIPDRSAANSASNPTFDPSALTPRQREVFDLMLTGRSTKEMARTLDIAEGTVKIYLAAIFRLLDVRNRIEAVTKSLSLGSIAGRRHPR
jgi:DNA-binding NarL/FixJ family response regulator